MLFEAFVQSLDFKELEELKKRLRSEKKSGDRLCFELNFLESTTEFLQSLSSPIKTEKFSMKGCFLFTVLYAATMEGLSPF